MTTIPPTSPNSAQLRSRAETHLRQKKRLNDGGAKTRSDARRLFHELQVHQIELEMQNAELRQVRDRLEVTLDEYTDLYDFAPGGYFTLNAKGDILQVNLTGATLVGIERSRLVGQTFGRLLSAGYRSAFRIFLEQVFAGSARQSGEFELPCKGRPLQFVNIEAQSLINGHQCRAVVVDITAGRIAEGARCRLEAMTASNRELEREIVRRKAVELALKTSEQKLRQLSHDILLTQEAERKRISRELHDTVLQTLVGVRIHLLSLTKEPTDNPRNLRRKIMRTQLLVGSLLSMVHRFAVELRPSALDDLGLIPALHTFMQEFMTRTGVRGKLTAFAAVNQLPVDQSGVLYRVALEALNNVALHAKATLVDVQIRRLPEWVCMTITDDGKSFDVKRVLRANGTGRLGLLGMRERLEMIGGKLAIKSTPGHGTSICAKIPLATKVLGKKKEPVPQTKA